MPARWRPGSIRPGAAVVNAVSGTEAKVARIVTMDGDLEEAVPGEAVTLVLDREIDVSRGDVLAVAPPPALADQVTAWVVWMDETPLFRGRAYLFMLGSRSRGRHDHRDRQPAGCRYARRGAGARTRAERDRQGDDFAGAARRRASATRSAGSWAASS